jgi:hypothetical protein
MLALTGNTLTLGWPSVSGRVYQVQYADQLLTPTWTTLGPDQSGTGSTLSLIVDVSGAPQRYYRIVVVR